MILLARQPDDACHTPNLLGFTTLHHQPQPSLSLHRHLRHLQRHLLTHILSYMTVRLLKKDLLSTGKRCNIRLHCPTKLFAPFEKRVLPTKHGLPIQQKLDAQF